MINILTYKKLNNLNIYKYKILYKIMLENLGLGNILDFNCYLKLLENKSIKLEILNKEYFDEIKFNLIKILYYNKISYNINDYNNKIILTLKFNNNNINENNLIYENFDLNDLLKILNLDVKNPNEYLLHINKNLSNIKY